MKFILHAMLLTIHLLPLSSKACFVVVFIGTLLEWRRKSFWFPGCMHYITFAQSFSRKSFLEGPVFFMMETPLLMVPVHHQVDISRSNNFPLSSDAVPMVQKSRICSLTKEAGLVAISIVHNYKYMFEGRDKHHDQSPYYIRYTPHTIMDAIFQLDV